ncbi:MAG: hypothetical protein C4567_02440 [Deltaproteobacteria bacterium]|nr:MAG: hypothetical protein C4567_02440 [Deltaproteobacteria bacterium]
MVFTGHWPLTTFHNRGAASQAAAMGFPMGNNFWHSVETKVCSAFQKWGEGGLGPCAEGERTMLNIRRCRVVRITGLLAVFLVILLAAAGSQARMMEIRGKTYDIAEPGEFKSGEVVVRARPGTSRNDIEGMAAQMQGRIKKVIPEYDLYLIEVPPPGEYAAQKAQVNETVRTLEKFSQVKRAYPNFKVSIPKPSEIPANNGDAKEDRQAPGAPSQQGVAARTAVSSGNQWHLDKIKFHTAGAAPDAAPMVAVLDTGVDYTHPDLAANVVLGWDFVDDDDDPMDEGGHGTHMAGLIAASPAEGTGITGVSPTSKILAVRVLDLNGAGTWFQVMQGIIYARDNEARIINLSLVGYDLPGSSAYEDLQQVIDDTVAADKIVCVAAGNDDNYYSYDDIYFFPPPNLTPLPAGLANAFTVTASEWNDCRVYFSNYDAGTLSGVAYNLNFVDLAAPGWKMYSTIPISQGGYANQSGTSGATAVVAGCAARVWAKYPAYTAAQVQNRLISTGAATGSSSGGNGFYAAEKRVDLMKALGQKATGFSGVVFNGQNGLPLPGVKVVATPDGITATTNASGFYTLTGLTAGTTYSLKFSRSTFGSVTLGGQVAVADKIKDLPRPAHLNKQRAAGQWTVLFSHRNFHPGYQDAVYTYQYDWWPIPWAKTSGLHFAPRLERNGTVIVEPSTPGSLVAAPYAAITNDDWNRSSGSKNMVISQVQSGTYRIWTRLDNFQDSYYEWGSYKGPGQSLKARIYNGADLQGTAVAAKATGSGSYWWVADLSGGTLTIQNKMGTTAPPF